MLVQCERVKQFLEKQCGAKSRLVEALIGVARELALDHLYSNEWMGSPFRASAR